MREKLKRTIIRRWNIAHGDLNRNVSSQCYPLLPFRFPESSLKYRARRGNIGRNNGRRNPLFYLAYLYVYIGYLLVLPSRAVHATR